MAMRLGAEGAAVTVADIINISSSRIFTARNHLAH